MPDTEAALLSHVKRLSKELNIGCYKINSPMKRGMPDLLMVDKCINYFLELKTPAGTGRLSPQQVYMIRELRDYGALVFVVSDFDCASCLLLAMHAHCLIVLLENR